MTQIATTAIEDGMLSFKEGKVTIIAPDSVIVSIRINKKSVRKNSNGCVKKFRKGH